jgi:tetratricopeptide (TPR) repeat protein
LLVGAGVSVTAGIPVAAGFVDEIRRRFPAKVKRMPEAKTYPECMARLLTVERRDLISEYVDAAKINWAHVCIALLMEHGYVDRVLTTNFDPLVAKACALAGVFPAVYDFAASQLFKPANLPDQAVFHLHGQRTGFVILNTEEEVKRLSASSAPVFQNAGQGRTWIVVGYSGEQDPVFEHLANVPTFDNGLYWITYKDQEPGEHVKNSLISDAKSAFYVAGFDADSFFVTLCQALSIFPPGLVARPFTHLGKIMGMLAPFQLPGQSEKEDVTKLAREWIASAVVQYEDPIEEATRRAQEGTVLQEEGLPDPVVAAATELVMSGQYREALAFKKVYEKLNTPQLGDMLAWAHTMLGNQLVERARSESDPGKAVELLADSEAEYDSALKIKPSMHQALNNWGSALYDQATRKTGEAADTLYAQAYEKYETALKIKPDKDGALYNWGNALYNQAKTKTGEAADTLYAQAYEKYEAALKVKPDKDGALYNWGNALYDQATRKTGEAADTLYAQAYEKYEATLKVKPDKDGALYNWGNALSDQAKTKTGEAADTLYAQAYEKYEAALKAKPDDHSALYNWGNALSDQAKTKTGEAADTLNMLAKKKLEQAGPLQSNPSRTEAASNP